MSMTEKKKGSASPVKSERRQVRHRMMPVFAVVLVLFLILEPVLTILTIIGNRQSVSQYELSAAELADYIHGSLGGIIGSSSPVPLLMLVIGVAVGIYAFSYLFSNEKIDFYESQPVSRKQRFFVLYTEGALAVLVPYVLCTGLEAVTLLALGQRDMIGTMAEYALFTVFVLFISLSTGVLCVMLTGTAFTAFLMSVYLLCIELGIQLIGAWYAQLYYNTYAFPGLQPTISPLLSCLGVVSARAVLAAPALLMQGLICLVAGLVLLLFAYRLYLKRPAESAGKTVLHGPVRFIVKLSSASIIGLAFGAIIPGITGKSMGGGILAAMIAAILFGCVLTCGLIEAVYRRDIRSFFQHSWQMLLPSLIGVLAFLLFAFDWTGYDSFVPNLDSVGSVALVMYDEYTTTNDTDQAAMALTDTEEVQSVITAGMTNRKVAGDAAEGYSGIVIYHMKNGRNIRREITIPYTVRTDYMDAITKQQSYKEAVCNGYALLQAYENGEIPASDNAVVTYSGAIYYKESRDPDNSLAMGFLKVYLEEYTEQYCYSLASTTSATGCFTIGDQSTYYIYPSFTKTIQWLKDNGLYSPDLSDVTVTRVVTTVTTDEKTGEQTSVDYTDEDQILEITKSLGGYYDIAWNHVSDEGYCEVDVYYLDPTDESNEEQISYYVDITKLPAYVQAALN